MESVYVEEGNKMQQDLKRGWDEAIEDDQKMEEYLEKEYKSMLQQLSMGSELNEELLNETWQKAGDYEEHLQYAPSQNKQYNFKDDNPFREDEQTLEKARHFYDQGQTSLAILAFEAHLQKRSENMADYQTWKILGTILQDND